MTKNVKIITLASVLLALSACSSSSDKKEEKARVVNGSLTRSFDLIDSKDGVRYGNVDMDPVGGGKVFDADGRLIGYITPPSKSGYDRDRDR